MRGTGPLARVAAAAAVLGAWLVVPAQPAAAHDCSGLSDCFAGNVRPALWLLLGLLLVLGIGLLAPVVGKVLLGFAARGLLGAAARSRIAGALARGLARLLRRPARPPTVSSGGKLQNIINSLYKGVNNPRRVGRGTTADAVRHELRTGRLTHGRSHVTKARNEARGLRNWLRDNPNAPGRDRKIARRLLDELEDALRTVPRRQ